MGLFLSQQGRNQLICLKSDAHFLENIQEELNNVVSAQFSSSQPDPWVEQHGDY